MMRSTPGLQHLRGTFTGADATDRYEQAWRPSGDARAAVVLVHGYAEHSGRHRDTAEKLVAQGYAVYAFDLSGHGQSSGARGYVESFDVYLDDLDLFLQRTQDRAPDKPVFLMGHSLGGTIVALYAINHQPEVQGLILSGPVLQVGEAMPSLLVRLSPLAGRLFPRMSTIKIDSEDISRDPEVVARYRNDPLVYHGGMPARTGAEILQAVETIQERMEHVRRPFLILHGTSDRLADAEGSSELYRRARSEDKQLRLYEGFFHEVLNEPERARVLADLVAWLDARVDQTPTGAEAPWPEEGE